MLAVVIKTLLLVNQLVSVSIPDILAWYTYKFSDGCWFFLLPPLILEI
jgi:hypothetical protein